MQVFLVGEAILDAMLRPLPDAAILVEKGRILQVAARATVQYDASTADIVDLRDKVVAPGLIDMHIHVTGGLRPYGIRESDERILDCVVRGARNCQEWLRDGVTLARNMGTRDDLDLQFRDAIEEGLIPGPRILASGRSLCITGGHLWWVGIEIDGADEARKAVRAQIKSGADVIKLMASSGGHYSGGWARTAAFGPALTVEEMAAAIEEVRKAGRLVGAHCTHPAATKNVILAGIDVVDHAQGLDQEALQMLVERGVSLVPVMANKHDTIRRGEEERKPAKVLDLTRRTLEQCMEWTRRAHEAGARIAAGTDGRGGVAIECELLTQAGLSNRDSLAAATRNAAEILGMIDSEGTIAPGKRANFIVMQRSPLEDITELQRLEAVVKDGVMLEVSAPALG